MVFEFSEESRFILKHWRTIEELTDMLERFPTEFTKYLYSLESVLKGRSWWKENEKLYFNTPTDNEVYISKQDWFIDGDYYIWIGVENFTPVSILGNKGDARCYLWVSRYKEYQIAKGLMNLLRKNEEFSDEPTETSKEGDYLIIRVVKKTYQDDNGDIVLGETLEKIADFFEVVYGAIKNYKIK